MIDLNNYRENIYHNAGIRNSPCYGEDGIFKKIFELVGVSKKPLCIEFGELRVLGTTSRQYRIQNVSSAVYFSATMDLKSHLLNILDIFKVCIKSRNLKFLRFFGSLPKKKLVTPENVLSCLQKFREKKIDLVVVDIDSFDYEVVQRMLTGQILPKVFVVEYNPSLPWAENLTFKYTHLNNDVRNKRFYGASVRAWINLFSQFNYTLIHISGFCNLHFIKKEFSILFQSPNISNEITDTNDKVLQYAAEFCLPGFVPSWLDEPPLTSQELDLLRSSKSEKIE